MATGNTEPKEAKIEVVVRTECPHCNSLQSGLTHAIKDSEQVTSSWLYYAEHVDPCERISTPCRVCGLIYLVSLAKIRKVPKPHFI